MCAAQEVARALELGLLPTFIGIRIKSLSEEWKWRVARTPERFIDAPLSKTRDVLPPNFVVTFGGAPSPKYWSLVARGWAARRDDSSVVSARDEQRADDNRRRG